MLPQISVEVNHSVVLPNNNLFPDNVNEYNEFRDHCVVPYNLLYCVQSNQARNTVMNTENVNAYLLLPTQKKSDLNGVQTGRRNKEVGSNAIMYRLAQ